MAVRYELVRVINAIEGEIVEAAKSVVQGQRFSSDASRSQFKLAVEGARQTEDLRLLKAFLAYQASRDDKVWGHRAGRQLFLQQAWSRLQQQIQTFESRAQNDERSLWQQATDSDRHILHRMVAERFFAHIERAFEIWKDDEVKDFYFDPSPPAESSPDQQGGRQNGN